jgi:hypothetical protein
MNNQISLSGKKVLKPAPKGKIDKFTNIMMWAISGPIIVSPGGWGDDLPDTIKSDLAVNRLVTAMEISKTPEVTPMAPEIEAMWFLSTASLECPLDRDWTEIYMMLTRRWMQSKGKDIPEFLVNATELNDMQKGDLKRLREWIFKKSFEEVRRKCKEMNKSTSENQKMEIPSLKRTTKQMDLSVLFG